MEVVAAVAQAVTWEVVVEEEEEVVVLPDSSTSPMFVFPHLLLVTHLMHRLLTHSTAALQCRLARPERPLPTIWYVIVYAISKQMLILLESTGRRRHQSRCSCRSDR